MKSPAKASITLRLGDVSQLFNPMDTSPVHERDLDADAAELILNCSRGHQSSGELGLVVNLAFSSGHERLDDVETAVHRHFAARADAKRHELGQLMRRGRLSLAVGLVFLAVCLLLGGLIPEIGANAALGIVKEGLTICGWVAMWKPLEIYLYDWWPLLEESRQFDRLARVSVQIVPASPLTSFGKASQAGNDHAIQAAA